MMLSGAWLLLRHSWWTAAALMLLSFAPFTYQETFVRALIVWLALLGLVMMIAVLGNGFRNRRGNGLVIRSRARTRGQGPDEFVTARRHARLVRLGLGNTNRVLGRCYRRTSDRVLAGPLGEPHRGKDRVRGHLPQTGGLLLRRSPLALVAGLHDLDVGSALGSSRHSTHDAFATTPGGAGLGLLPASGHHAGQTSQEVKARRAERAPKSSGGGALVEQ